MRSTFQFSQILSISSKSIFRTEGSFPHTIRLVTQSLVYAFQSSGLRAQRSSSCGTATIEVKSILVQDEISFYMAFWWPVAERWDAEVAHFIALVHENLRCETSQMTPRRILMLFPCPFAKPRLCMMSLFICGEVSHRKLMWFLNYKM